MTILLALTLLSSARAAEPAPDLHALSSYSFDASRPTAERVERIPDWLLAAWKKADEAPEYRAYLPTKEERRQFASALDGLPADMRRTLRERLIAFYFVENLKGNGITNWALDASSRTYVTMILNPAGFRKTLSQILTERERSAFRGAPDLEVDAGPGGSGIVYTASHECAHAYDYVRGLTPFVEPRLAKRLGQVAPAGWDVWESYSAPRREDDYPLRAKLAFYGLGGPNLDAADAPAVCAQRAASPFVSLYGSRSWAEDLAELFVARHLVRDLGRPYRVTCGGRTDEPLTGRRAARAERALTPLYGP